MSQGFVGSIGLHLYCVSVRYLHTTSIEIETRTSWVWVNLPQLGKRNTCQAESKDGCDARCRDESESRKDKPLNVQASDKSTVEEKHVELQTPDDGGIAEEAKGEELGAILPIFPLAHGQGRSLRVCQDRCMFSSRLD